MKNPMNLIRICAFLIFSLTLAKNKTILSKNNEDVILQTFKYSHLFFHGRLFLGTIIILENIYFPEN